MAGREVREKGWEGGREGGGEGLLGIRTQLVQAVAFLPGGTGLGKSQNSVVVFFLIPGISISCSGNSY